MSAESPKRSRSLTRSSSGDRPSIVNPQQVTDPTILDSVAGFINDVVPNAYNIQSETKDQIQWVHFEQLEFDESTFSPDYDNDHVIIPTLILVLGYATGIQVWAVPASGEATEILSWRHGSLRTMKIIPNPYVTGTRPPVDLFATRRPLIALCDMASQYLTVNFHSLKTGDSVKPIRFQSPVLNILANRHSVVITFAEKFAVFDSFTLEPRLSITTCYLSPGLQQNPIALSSRWLAYAEKKLNTMNRSGGGSEGEGVQSYTATVLHAAKSFSRGLRELGETVASSFTGNSTGKLGTSPNSPQAGGVADAPQKGIITILDIENPEIDTEKNYIPNEAVIAHFVAHTEAIVYLNFDSSGLLLLTADKRGHDFHLFRIQSHPIGSSLAAVHHLYVLHRGDTTAKVQDMCFSPDSRWVTVSTLRGTTHVFPITPYGGNVGIRTHGTPLVVNKMSRFHRSAGLTAEGRSNSPVSLTDLPSNTLFPYQNPRFPPYPQPVIINPIAQIRQPIYIQQNTSSNSFGGGGVGGGGGQTIIKTTHSGRQRLSSTEDNIALRVVANFSPPRAWLDYGTTTIRSTLTETTNKQTLKPVESLFIMSCHGNLIQYDLDPRPIPSIPKERICNDTPIELKVQPKAQWFLQRQINTKDIPMPMSIENLKYVMQDVPKFKRTKPDHNDDNWLSQVEIVTHSGPHRRLWMGPQFTFKTYMITNGAVVETRPLDVRRSKPVNMPITKTNAILIESGSASSCEQLFLDTYHEELTNIAGESQLKEDLADAMLESPGVRDTGGHCVIVSMKPTTHATTTTTTVAKVVNPLGTVVTLHSDDDDIELELMDDDIIHENCDEALFRPIVPPKPLYYADSTKRSPCSIDNILTKSLDSNTEVTVKIINSNKNNNKCKDIENSKNRTNNNNKMLLSSKYTNNNNNNKPKSRDSSPKSCKILKSKDCKLENKNNLITKSNKAEFNLIESTKIQQKLTESCSKVKSKFVESVENKSTTTPTSCLVEKKSATTPTLLQPVVSKIDDIILLNTEIDEKLLITNSSSSSTKKDKDILQRKKKDDFDICLIDEEIKETTLKKDKFDDIINYEDCNKQQEGNNLIKCSNTTDIIEEIVEEKTMTKKLRKPKTKLGIKIPNTTTIVKTTENVSPEIPKRSWNLVVGGGTTTTSSSSSSKQLFNDDNEKSLSESFEKEKKIFDLPKLELPPDFQYSRNDYKTTTTTSKIDVDEIDYDLKKGSSSSESSLLKLFDNKSSDDDEKIDNCGGGGGNSETTTATTTESDDSSKIPLPPLAAIVNIMDNEEEDQSSVQIIQKSSAMSSSSKKKSKKKRK